MRTLFRPILMACDPRGYRDALAAGPEDASASLRCLMSMLDPTAPGLTLRFLLPEEAVREPAPPIELPMAS